MHYIFRIDKLHYLLKFNATLKGVINSVVCFIIQCKPRPWRSYKGIICCKALLKTVLGSTLFVACLPSTPIKMTKDESNLCFVLYALKCFKYEKVRYIKFLSMFECT
jgi:hypothetical protein